MQVSSMVERLNLLTLLVLAAVTRSSIAASSIEEIFADICKNNEEYRDRGCLLMCQKSFCWPYCLCAGGKVICSIHRQTCSCKQGWKGDNCTEPCPSGFFGIDCAYECKCKNNGTCDRFSGGCTCTAGYQGSLCEQKCSNGTHGYECPKECKCQNDAICHHVDGSCDCTAGWMGPVCAEPCPKGTYGINCSKTCNCFKNAPCSVTTGECRNRACPANKWGHTCSNDCKCRNGRFCNPVTGVCWCGIRWTGKYCSVSLNKAHFADQITGKEYPSSPSSFSIPAICVPIMSALSLIIAYICKKRRLRNEENVSSTV